MHHLETNIYGVFPACRALKLPAVFSVVVCVVGETYVNNRLHSAGFSSGFYCFVSCAVLSPTSFRHMAGFWWTGEIWWTFHSRFSRSHASVFCSVTLSVTLISWNVFLLCAVTQRLSFSHVMCWWAFNITFACILSTVSICVIASLQLKSVVLRVLLKIAGDVTRQYFLTLRRALYTGVCVASWTEVLLYTVKLSSIGFEHLFLFYVIYTVKMQAALVAFIFFILSSLNDANSLGSKPTTRSRWTTCVAGFERSLHVTFCDCLQSSVGQRHSFAFIEPESSASRRNGRFSFRFVYCHSILGVAKPLLTRVCVACYVTVLERTSVDWCRVATYVVVTAQ